MRFTLGFKNILTISDCRKVMDYERSFSGCSRSKAVSKITSPWLQKTEGSVYQQGLLFVCVCVYKAISMCVCVCVCWVYKYPRVSQQSWVWVAGSGYVRSHNGLQWTAWPQIRSTKCDTNSFSLTPRWHCLSPGLSVPLWVCVCVCVWRLLWSYSSLVHTCITSITSLFTFFCPQMWI